MSNASPEIPYPFPPEPPSPQPPRTPSIPWVPVVDDARLLDPRQRLYEQRRLLVTGPLDGPHVEALVATLMALDGLSADRVELVVSSSGGALTDILPVLDVIALMRAPVDTLCIGPTAGTAAVVVACATGRRRATPHASLSMRCADEHEIHGSVEQVTQHAAELNRLRAAIAERLTTATGQSAATVDGWLTRGPALTPAEAIAVGLLDELAAARR
jgi:ATP-dependent Clp protease protease subunit